jgi:hypothetical protein
MSIEDLRFTPRLLSTPPLRGLAVETTLQHFAIVTYAVDADRLRTHLHPRFEPDVVEIDAGPPRALVSVVTFLDKDFRFVAMPWFTGRFGQTNYRAYVLDTHTGEHAAWFFGTCLDSWSVAVPRYVWKLPWHRSRMTFDCRYDDGVRRYSTFSVATESQWAPGRLVLEDSGEPPNALAGFSNLESGLVLLTHPLRGHFFRRRRPGLRHLAHRLEPTVGAEIATYPRSPRPRGRRRHERCAQRARQQTSTSRSTCLGTICVTPADRRASVRPRRAHRCRRSRPTPCRMSRSCRQPERRRSPLKRTATRAAVRRAVRT